MASSQGITHSEPAKLEQIITEFFAKSLHIILESRCPYVSSRNYSGEQVLSSPSPSSSSSLTSSFRPRDKWFNLALRDCPAALENFDFWRQSNLEPMIIDVILEQRPSNYDPLICYPKGGLVRNLSGKERDYYSSDNDEFGCETMSGKIIERWVLHYESKKSGGDSGGLSGSKRLSSTSSHALYKESILLLRSLYATVRILPAYKLFRDLISSAQIGTYTLGHRVSTFVAPFTRREEVDMQRFVFTPIDTSCGRLCLSVSYRSSVLDVSSEPSTPMNSEPSTPMSPQFIPEYVESPMAEPLKRFASGPMSPPSSSPFGRRHSWSYDLYRASSYPGNIYPKPPRMDLVITEFFAKFLDTILRSRCPEFSSPSSSSSFMPRNQWITLGARNCRAAVENTDSWRHIYPEPMIVDVILFRRRINPDPISDESEWEGLSEKIIERWILKYDSNESSAGLCGSESSTCFETDSFYQKSILWYTSLCMTLRHLPAHKLFCDLISSSGIQTYNLCQRISPFVAQFSPEEESSMQRFVFTPMEISCGRLCLSVLYSSSISITNEQSSPYPPLCVTESVGIPVSDQHDRLSSMPASQCSQSISPSRTHHRWSYGFQGASISYSNFDSTSKPRSSHHTAASLYRSLPGESPQVQMRNTGHDSYWPSTLSSQSPSSAISIPGNQFHNLLDNDGLNIPSNTSSGPQVQTRNAAHDLYWPSNLSSQSPSSTMSIPGNQFYNLLEDDVLNLPSNTSSPKSLYRSSSRCSVKDDCDDQFPSQFSVDI